MKKNEISKSKSEEKGFFSKYQNTISEFKSFYKEKESKGGLLVEHILVDEKLNKLYSIISNILNTIFMVKTRLVVHPCIESASKSKLLNFEESLSKYLKIYTHICTDKNIVTNNIHEKIDLSVIVKLLNFYEEKSIQEKK